MVVGSTLLDGYAVVISVLRLATVCDFLAFVEIVVVGSLTIDTCVMRESAFIQCLLVHV